MLDKPDSILRRQRFGLVAIGSTLLVGGLFLVFPSYRFSDYQTYVDLTDEIFLGIAKFRFLIDPISTGLMFGLRSISENSLDAVGYYRDINLLFFLAFYFYSLRIYKSSWQSAVILLAMEGPLLAFVTLRATPAYFLVVIAAMEAARGRVRSLPLVLLGGAFHVSAFLALPSVVLCFIQNRKSGAPRKPAASSSRLVRLIVALALGQLLLGSVSIQLVDFIAAYLPKYGAYISNLDPDAATGGLRSINVSHQIYVAFATALLIFYVLQKDQRCVAFRGYIVTSYVVFIILEFAPAAAFRQSIFWVMPAILLIPWERYARSQLVSFGLLLGACAVFWFNFSLVVISA